MLGGENQSSKLFLIRASSAKAHCTSKPSYLKPNSSSMHVPIEGVYRVAEKIEDRSRIGEKHIQNHAENAPRTLQSLLYEFAFLPSQVLAMALSAFRSSCRIRASAVPANLLVQPSFLRYSLLHWVKYRHRATSCSELAQRWFSVKYTFCAPSTRTPTTLHRLNALPTNSATSPGFSATPTPALTNASILLKAVPALPTIMAPAWPMCFSGGAERPAM